MKHEAKNEAAGLGVDAFLADLRSQFLSEFATASRYSEVSDAEIIEGAVVIDPRNLSDSGTVRSMARRKFITKFGERMDGVQYYTLTADGLAAVRA